jgi:hypothetical protein
MDDGISRVGEFSGVVFVGRNEDVLDVEFSELVEENGRVTAVLTDNDVVPIGVSRLSRLTSAPVNNGMMMSRSVKKPIPMPEI